MAITRARFSPLTQINSANVASLTRAWTSKVVTGDGETEIKATPLVVNGIMYIHRA